MKQQVSPIAVVLGVVFALFILFFMAYRTLGPKPEAYTISPPELDADGAKAKRANHLKALGQTPEGAASPRESGASTK